MWGVAVNDRRGGAIVREELTPTASGNRLEVTGLNGGAEQRIAVSALPPAGQPQYEERARHEREADEEHTAGNELQTRNPPRQQERDQTGERRYQEKEHRDVTVVIFRRRQRHLITDSTCGGSRQSAEQQQQNRHRGRLGRVQRLAKTRCESRERDQNQRRHSKVGRNGGGLIKVGEPPVDKSAAQSEERRHRQGIDPFAMNEAFEHVARQSLA